MSLPVYDEVLANISSYICYYEVSNNKAWERAKISLLDVLGCAIETCALSTEYVQMLGPVAPGTIVPNGLELPGITFQLDPLKGAFDLRTMIRYLDHNDAYPWDEWGHPPGRISLSSSPSSPQHQPPMTIRTLLTAITKPYTIQGLYQARNAFNAHGLDHTILVKIASTGSISYLPDLSEAQTTASPNTGPRKCLAAGDASMRAVHLALLTERGQPGCPTAVSDPEWGFQKTLFGKKKLVLLRPFGTSVTESVFFKLVTAKGHGIASTEAALEGSKKMQEHGITGPSKAIESVKIRGQKPAMAIIDKCGTLRNEADHDHCVQYMVAVTLLKGDWIDAVDYEDQSPWASDLRVDKLREKMEMVEDEQFARDFYDAKKRSGSSGVKVVLRDGVEMDECVVEWPIGHPWRGDTKDAV
ncbi:2-methylcitrate dehydratase PrpD [Lepidopterella palustris CBS 459.81]|uniref:2-methylcitrate dehydratase PrpD n=1 Tax=Lepidopterella palustris CBS 459.81 TaxID=1314670 RepID=A0A8E2E0B3_9PEZI|nr:2-methylcitrate dehydratase PrpD [Lepidopterella palustris CBS 459.81]